MPDRKTNLRKALKINNLQSCFGIIICFENFEAIFRLLAKQC